MKVEDHVQYVKQLSDLQDSEGKRVSSIVLREVKRLFVLSGGNMEKCLKLLGVSRGRILRALEKEMRDSQIRAQELGVSFGRKKLNG
jgi:hypothetical protein